MACDIHLHQEIKVYGEWEHYRHRCIDQNYRIFSKLGNVGLSYDGPLVTSFKVKGFPNDASLITKINYIGMGTDAHTPSYLNSFEISQLMEWWNSIDFNWASEKGFSGYWGFLFGKSFGNFLKDKDSYLKQTEDIRFVFWFDN